MELKKCDLCESFDNNTFLETSGYGTEYTLVKCNVCGLVFMNPVPEDERVEKYYKKIYFKQQTGSSAPSKEYIDHISGLDQKRFKFFKKHVSSNKNKSVLDVGCGMGGFIDVLKNNTDHYVFGIEPNEKFSKYANNHGMSVITGALNDVPLTNKYDVLIMWQVLNMVPRALPFLRRARELLDHGGQLLLDVPNYLQSPKLPWKKRIFPNDPGQFFYFNKSTLKHILKVSGFKDIKIRYVEKGSWMRAVCTKNG